MADESRVLEAKLQKFAAEVMGIAQEKREAIEQELESYRSQELEGYRAAAENDSRRLLHDELGGIETGVKTALSAEKARLRSELLQLREQYLQQVFADAAVRLRAFADSPAYADFLRAKAEKLAGEHRFENAVVLVRPADMNYEDTLRTAFAGAQVRADEGIALGGFVLERGDGRLRVDATLDSNLEAQKSWFYQNCGLQITL